jgi:hypothetical protein
MDGPLNPNTWEILPDKTLWLVPVLKYEFENLIDDDVPMSEP